MAFFRTRQGESLTIQEGNSDRGVTVKSINGYEVTIEYEGKPQVMKLFDGKSDGGAPGGSPPMTTEREGAGMPEMPPPSPPHSGRGKPVRVAPGAHLAPPAPPPPQPQAMPTEEEMILNRMDIDSSIKFEGTISD